MKGQQNSHCSLSESEWNTPGGVGGWRWGMEDSLMQRSWAPPEYISKSTERHPRLRVYHYSPPFFPPLQSALLPEPASKARDAQKAAQYRVFPL